MYRIALNVAISHERHATRHGLPSRNLEPEDAARIAAPAPPESDERISELNRVIARLDPLIRALALLYLEERSYQEIADVLGLSKTNVATKINRLKQRIRNDMADGPTA